MKKKIFTSFLPASDMLWSILHKNIFFYLEAKFFLKTFSGYIRILICLYKLGFTWQAVSVKDTA